MRINPIFLFLGTLLLLACKQEDVTSGSSDSGASTGLTGDTQTGETETETDPGSTTEPEPEPESTTDTTTGSESEGDTELPTTDTDETTDAVPSCTNGILEEDEQCDDGILDDNGPCVSGCVTNICGDGKVWTGVEDCDAGAQNGAYAGSCGLDCTEDSVPKCGDGILQEDFEVCELGDTNQDGVDCHPEQCSWGDFRYVFVTSHSFRGDLATEFVDENLTGLARADAICQALAGGAVLPGDYYAWLSDNNNAPGSDAVDRIGGAQDSPNATYVMPNGGVALANGWSDFVSNGPAIAITKTEKGEPVEPLPAAVWTNTSMQGLSLGQPSCDNWTSTDSVGWFGKTATGMSWTDHGSSFCNVNFVHLYCVQGVAK